MSGEPVRDEDVVLDPLMCHTLLATQRVGRLVTLAPVTTVVPVNYVVDDDVVVFRTTVESDAARRVGQDVLFEVDVFDERTRSGWSVVVTGRLRAVPRPRDRAPVETWAPGDRDHSLGVSMDGITGRILRGDAVDRPDAAGDGYL
jgi:nitroimidazol reductase NimA-like FMN-containing flavoprotein (pyridoxamine 5'-phosphate oxidase superfamily)